MRGMEAETMVCRKCKIEKPLSEYYTRSGLPHLHLKMCKACYRELSKCHSKSTRSHRREAVVESEKKIIELLKKEGVPALPGKALGHQYADIIAWGCVLIESKYATIRDDKYFAFGFSPQQRKHGIRGDLVVLACDYGDRVTYHIFESSDPIFYYGSGKLKASVCYMPDVARRKNRSDRVTLLPDYMKAHEDRWDLIENVRLNVSAHLINQSSTLAKRLRYLDAPDPRTTHTRYNRKLTPNSVTGRRYSQPS